MSRHCGFFRASVRLSRSLLEHPQLTRWSVDELVVLFTLQEGAPAYYGLRRTSSWCDMMDVCGSKKVTHVARADPVCTTRGFGNLSAIASGADKDNDMGEGTPAVAMSRWCTRVLTYIFICI